MNLRVIFGTNISHKDLIFFWDKLQQHNYCIYLGINKDSLKKILSKMDHKNGQKVIKGVSSRRY